MNLRRRSIHSCCVLLLLLVAAVFLWRVSWNAASVLEASTQLAVLRDVGLSAADCRSMAEAEEKALSPLSFALWRQEEGQTVVAAGAGRSAALSVVSVLGDVRLVLPQSMTLWEEDYSGCLIDRQTALDLTGTQQPLGLELQWMNQLYTVRGVVQAPVNTMVIMARPQDTIPFPHLSLEGSADRFIQRHILSPSLIVSGSLYAEMAGLCRWLPVFTAGLLLMVFLLSRRSIWRHYPLRTGLLLVLVSAVATCIVLSLLRILPAWMLPTRWSDFEAWSTLAREAASYATRFLSAQWLVFDRFHFATLIPCLTGLLSSVLLIICYRIIPQKTLLSLG